MTKRRPAFLLAVALLFCLFLPSSAQETSERGGRSAGTVEGRHLLKESLDWIESGEFDSAFVCLHSVLERDPKNPDALFHTGRFLLWQGDSAGAISMLEVGVKAAPLSSRLKLLLARLMLAQGNIDSAAELVDGVLLVKPREGEALYLRGRIFLERGDTARAIDSWEEALRARLGR